MAQVAATILTHPSAPGQLTADRKTVSGYVYDASVVAVRAGKAIAPATTPTDAYSEVLLSDGTWLTVNTAAYTFQGTLTGMISIVAESGRVYVKPAHVLRVVPTDSQTGEDKCVVWCKGLQLTTVNESAAALIARLNA